MARQWSIVWLAPALAAGLVTAAGAATLAPTTIRMSTIRIEPARPGGLPGSPRERSPSCQFETDATVAAKCIAKPKRHRR